MKLPLIVVCTHHKTGTVWMASIFRGLKRQFKLKLHAGLQTALPEEADIFLQDHSRVEFGALRALAAKRERAIRVVHVIRDPRDVIISGCFYHVKTVEKWANKPRPTFGGKTYREAISALPSDHEKLLFEMNNAGGKTIRDMIAWEYSNKDVFEAKYEDLIDDKSFRYFRPMMQFLGFVGQDLEKALEVVNQNSLFGAAGGGEHVRSGETKQWQKIFTPVLKQAFLERFPDSLDRLKYDANW